ncbi:DUF4326 domain-containing protein [Lysinibacillus xylanilyticus]|uniref:DUF4326 domain-containing protein n=1 Tax=Lysinibacillus xylanilyticus TaxID=582475 RepID=UPI0036D90E08
MPYNIKVVNRHHRVPFDVYIGRGSKWGNPFTHRSDTQALAVANSKEEAIEMYRLWIQTQPHLMNSLWELDGKTLGCSCFPEPCHGNVLQELRQQQYETSTK